MITLLFPAIVAIAGLILYFAATNPKVQRVGEIMFFCGLIATMLLSESVVGHAKITL